MSSSRTETGVVDVVMPQLGVSVVEGTVVEWRKAVGDRVEADEIVVEVSTDKIDTEIPAPAAGVVSELLVGAGETVAVGMPLARIEAGDALTDDGVPAEGQPPASGGDDAGAEATGNGAGRRLSPVVQRIAADHAIDLSEVEGTGRDGRIRKQDVLAHVETAQAPLHTESPFRPESVPKPESAPVGGTLSRMRRTIGEHMKRSLETAATCTTWIEVDMSRVERERAALGLTALPLVARATIDALREHPQLNAWLEDERHTVHDDVHLGIAVSLDEDGLIVPVVRDAHDLSPEGLGRRIRDLARRARAGELTADEVRGATFTLTNPGQYGALMATPVISQPQVAILDIEAIIKRPVVVAGPDGEDAIAIRPMCVLGLSWDHRALDGVLAARFLSAVRRRLEGGPS
ncbi:MAG: 2-oxo acid dehydrogenase subunit E2 [Actinomycetota bacterium]|nr:2-oxo acid dehydrogenase subunit E2 [Solirubrobacterales bacterium]MDQ3371292.1 2-oxo acid dehydrogenase subunit E2 [Actinomycetota bacterium]MDQ3410292.1 2-oxo acid dehydrogenase subunit E2 [Actinomycetota bacterium]